jgi:hypothetical protein
MALIGLLGAFYVFSPTKRPEMAIQGEKPHFGLKKRGCSFRS